ncbi:MAG: hypothetical protein IT184_05310 [Acidobacteria bacterium]|nr:hypothetical protein [Acidobacteriota bacterium]
MPELPSRLWKDLPLAKRLLAADAFWRDEDSPEIEVQQQEAVVALARRLKFRPKSILAEPVERRAAQLAHLPEVTDAIATRALIAYHFRNQQALMSSFLDALGIAHDHGLITQEAVRPPDRERLGSAVATMKGAFDPEDVRIYLRTLAVLDPETWANVDVWLND